MASLGELFIELGVKIDTQALKNVQGAVKGLRTNLLLVGGAFAAAVVGLDRFVNSSLKGVVALQNLNQQTGLSIEKLQKFQQAGQLANLSLNADQIAQSIGNVQRNLAEIRLGGGNLAPFQLLGISPLGKDVFQVIEELRGAIQGIDPAIATNLISQLGLSPEFINILRLSRKEFEALSQNTFLNKEQRRNIDALGTSITALKLNFKALKDQAVAKLAPSLNEIVQKFFKWLKDNGDRIVNTMSSLAKGVAAFANAVGNAFSLTGQFLENIIGLENGIKILAVAFAALSLSFSPFLLGLTAVILLLDDLAVYKKGGDSLFGDLVKGFKDLPEIGKVFAAVGGIVGLTAIAEGFGFLTGAIKAFNLALKLSPIFAFVSALMFLANAGDIGKNIANKFEKEAEEDPKGFFGKSRDFLDKMLGNDPEAVFNRIGLNPALRSQALAITNNNNITVNGIQDVDTFGREAGSVINNSMVESYKKVQAVQGGGLN